MSRDDFRTILYICIQLYDQDPSKPNRKIDDMRLLNGHGEYAKMYIHLLMLVWAVLSVLKLKLNPDINIMKQKEFDLCRIF